MTHVTDSFTTPICCWNFWVLGFALYLNEGKNIFWSIGTFFKESPQSMLFIQNPSSKHKWKSMPWTWAGQGHKLFLPLPHVSHLSATLNRCLTSLIHQFPPAMFQFPSWPAFLVLQIFLMQHNKRIYLVLMRKQLKIQHYQTFYQLALSYSDAKFQSR